MCTRVHVVVVVLLLHGGARGMCGCTGLMGFVAWVGGSMWRTCAGLCPGALTLQLSHERAPPFPPPSATKPSAPCHPTSAAPHPNKHSFPTCTRVCDCVSAPHPHPTSARAAHGSWVLGSACCLLPLFERTPQAVVMGRPPGLGLPQCADATARLCPPSRLVWCGLACGLVWHAHAHAAL